MTDSIAKTASVLPRKKRWRSVLLGLIILLCGIAIGAGSAVVIIQKVVLSAIWNHQEMPDRLTQRIRDKLHLTDEQTQKVRAIIVERQQAIQAVRRDCQPRLEKELEQAKEEIASVLDPRQAKAFRGRFDYLRRSYWPPPPPVN